MIVKKIIMTRGIQGSGKTTWALNWVNEDPLNRIRFNNDDIRSSQGIYWPSDKDALNKKEATVYQLKRAAIDIYMNAGYDIVLDNMNLNPREYDSISKIVEEFNSSTHYINNNTKLEEYSYIIEFKDFFIPVEECIARDALRPNPIGANVIKQTFKRYRKLILDTEIKKMTDNLIKPADNMPSAIIVDMDATLCFNLSGRDFYSGNAHELMADDAPNMPVIKIVSNWIKCKDTNDKVIILTGRERTEGGYNATLEWLHKYFDKDADDFMVLMRPEGDYRNGCEMKKLLYETNIKNQYNVDFVLDDSNKIVKMYREIGLTVLQPNEGKF